MNKMLLRQMRKIASTVSPDIANRIMYRCLMNKPLRLNPPETFNEKINYLKLNVFPHDPLTIQCADKVNVRDYVRDKGYAYLLNELYGVWDRAQDIDWSALPRQFVLKCNHGCGYNIICTDKTCLDIPRTIRQLNQWMAEDFGKVTCEFHYSRIPRKIICERFLEEDIIDYKFFCFDSKPRFFYVSQSPNGNFHRGYFACFNIDGTPASFQRKDHPMFEALPSLPAQLPEMTQVAAALAQDFPFVRVDLFSVGGRIYFSELTFTPCSGMMPLRPDSADLELGKMLDLERYHR